MNNIKESDNKKMNEEILEAWLQLTIAINNEKIVSEMPLNEILIYRYLYHSQDNNVTATDLCHEIGMLKSQMNRTLTSMEEKQLIQRLRSKQDKRQIFVTLNKDQTSLYEKEHERILRIVDRLIERVGMDNAEKALKLFKLIAQIAKEEIES